MHLWPGFRAGLYRTLAKSFFPEKRRKKIERKKEETKGEQ